MNVLQGICPICGRHYTGWALDNPRNHLCIRCGSPLEIRRDDVLIKNGSYPFETEEYRVDNGQKIIWENLCSKNLLLYMSMN